MLINVSTTIITIITYFFFQNNRFQNIRAQNNRQMKMPVGEAQGAQALTAKLFQVPLRFPPPAPPLARQPFVDCRVRALCFLQNSSEALNPLDFRLFPHYIHICLHSSEASAPLTSAWFLTYYVHICRVLAPCAVQKCWSASGDQLDR